MSTRVTTTTLHTHVCIRAFNSLSDIGEPDHSQVFSGSILKSMIDFQIVAYGS